MKDERLYLHTILERIERIQDFTKEGRESFFASKLTQDAVIRNFEIIGEAAKRISVKLKEQYPNVPWKRLSGFRDFLIHDYERVDMEQIWNVIERELDNLRDELQGVLEGYGT